MSRYFNALKWKICPLLLVIFQAVFHTVVCQGGLFWCGDKQEEPFIAVRGQNISRRFCLENGLTETQTLVWAKVVEDRLSDFIDNTSDNQGRYKLTKVPGGNAIDLFIAFTEQSDSGKHIIKIHQGAQKLCSVAVFNLTIESTDPMCSTLLDQESGRLQMSCQWFQVSGYQAQLLAGDQVVFEYEALGMGSEDDLNAANNMNKVSVYLSPDEQIVPNICLISDKQRQYNMTCEFHLIQNHAVRNDQTAPQRFKFECCPEKETSAVSWWYSSGGSLYSLNLPAEISVNKELESFICGVQHANFTVRVYSTENVLFADGKEYTLFLSPESEGTTEAIGKSSCEKIRLNATVIKKDKYHPKDNQALNMTSTQSNTVETNVSSNTPGTYDETTNTVTTWTWVLLVISVIFCLTTGFANCFYFALRKNRYHFGKGMNDGIQMNSIASAGDDGAQSRDLANSQTQPLEMCMEHNLLGDFARGGAQDQGEQKRERKTQFQKNQDDPPSLHLQLPFGEPESSFGAHHPTNHDSVVGDHGGAIRRTTTCSKASTNEHKGSDLASAQNDNTAYCSVDDVKDTPTDIAKESKSSQAASVIHPKPSSKGLEAHPDQLSGNALTSSSLKSETSQLKKKVRGASTGLDALYAKPDMSRKTKKVACLVPDCEYPKAPGPTPDLDPPLHLGHSSDSIFLGHADFYGNMITNPTDEVTDDGALYINASNHTLL